MRGGESPSSRCRDLLPASGEKEPVAMPCRIVEENGAAMSLRPACGEKVAGRPDEGLPFYALPIREKKPRTLRCGA